MGRNSPTTPPRSVLFCYRDPETGFSSIKKLQDLQRFPELVARGPIGQLLTNRVLESFVKDTTTEEDRKEKALQWLDSLPAEVLE